MSPEIKEDSDCFLTVSFHILLIRLCQVNKGQGPLALDHFVLFEFFMVGLLRCKRDKGTEDTCLQSVFNELHSFGEEYISLD